MIILLIIIAPLTFSFSFFKSKPRDYEDMANEISAKVAKKLAKKHQMDLIGEGGGMMGSVYMIGLSFRIHHPLERNEARARIIDCVEELLAAINANEEIRPFLKNYPFTPKNVQVAIFSIPLDGKGVFDPYIKVVSVDQNDYVTFRTEEPNSMSYKNKYREPYAEALTMLKGNGKISSCVK
jgi:hypothetical protein